jgi:hypothetical protein
MPLKLRMFIRQPTGAVLKRKKNGRVMLIAHIFIQCVISRFVWVSFKEALGWDKQPDNMRGVFWDWVPLGCTEYDLKLFTFAIIWWALWLTRSKMRMESKFPNQPCDVLFFHLIQDAEVGDSVASVGEGVF